MKEAAQAKAIADKNKEGMKDDAPVPDDEVSQAAEDLEEEGMEVDEEVDDNA